jgi:RNase P subunit RPR2
MRARCNHCDSKLVMQSGGRVQTSSLTKHYGRCIPCGDTKRVWLEVADVKRRRKKGKTSTKDGESGN